MPARYVRRYSKGQKNDFRDAEAIAEAVQRPTMKYVATKTADQLDLQAMHRVRERLVSQRTGIINQIRAFLLERGVAIRQGLRFLRAELPGILAGPSDALSPRMVRIIEDLAGDWRRLDERIEALSDEIEAIARHDAGCERLVSEWIGSDGLDQRLFGTHSLRRTKATLIYRRTGNLRPCNFSSGIPRLEARSDISALK
jgi:transposase